MCNLNNLNIFLYIHSTYHLKESNNYQMFSFLALLLFIIFNEPLLMFILLFDVKLVFESSI